MNSVPVQIFIINLERSAERRVEIENKMRSYGLSYEIFPAVDGNNISTEKMQQVFQKGNLFRSLYGRDMVRGEAGAALSHLALYKKVVELGLESVIIMEDDVEFDERLKYITDTPGTVAKIQRHYDLVLLGYCRGDLKYKRRGDLSFWGRIKLDNGLSVGAPVHWYWSAIGYLVSNNGAKKLLAEADDSIMQADFLTANSPAYGVKLGITKEPVIWPGEQNDISTIGVRRNDHTDSLTNGQMGLDDRDPKDSTRHSVVGQIKKIYHFFIKPLNALQRKIALFLLKLSRNQNQFIIQKETANKDSSLEA